MYPNLLQVVTLKSSGITSLEQVKGRKISTGSPGSGTNFMAEAVLKALGIGKGDYKDSRLSFTESANALRDGTIDVGFWSVGPGTSSILDLATTHDIHIIAITAGQAEKVLAANATYSSVDLGGGVYRGVDQPVPTIGVWNVMICQAAWTPAWCTNWSRPCTNTTIICSRFIRRRPTPHRKTRLNTLPFRCIPAPSNTSRKKELLCRPSSCLSQGMSGIWKPRSNLGNALYHNGRCPFHRF